MLLKKTRNFINNNNINFIEIDSTTSTMDEAKNYITHYDKNVIVLANEQTRGRGRRGNKWKSPPGNIYLSIALNNSIPMQKYFYVSMLTSISIKDSLTQFGEENILFKWPNDLFFDNKKFGGIILESYSSKSNKNYIIIGIGINFLSSPVDTAYKATHINNFVQINSIYIFLDFFLNFFFSYWNNFEIENKNIFSQYKNSLMYLNQEVIIDIKNDKSLKGVFKGINIDGSLILDQNSHLIRIYSGSIRI